MSGGDPGHPLHLLSDYLDDELSVEARSRVDRHLAECEACRAELSAMNRLALAIGDEEVPPPSLALAGRIGRALDEASVRRPARRRPFVPVTIAATIAAVGLLVVVSWRQGEVPAPVPMAPPEGRSKSQAVPMPPPPAEREEAPAAPPAEIERKDAFAPELRRAPAPKSDAPQSPSPRAPAQPDIGEEDAQDRLVPPRAEALAKSSDLAAATPSAGAVPAAPCADGYTDTGLRVRWPSPDAAALDREIAQIARDVGGAVLGAGREPAASRALVVPRDRFEEVFFALRARGLSGLDALPTLAPSAACASISIQLDPPGEPAR